MDKEKINDLLKNIYSLLDQIKQEVNPEVKKKVLWDDNDKKRIQEILNYIYVNFNKTLDYKDFKQWTIIKSLAKKYKEENEDINGGYDYVLSACEISKNNIDDPFCPKIFSAYDLKEKIEKIKMYYNQQQIKNTIKKEKFKY